MHWQGYDAGKKLVSRVSTVENNQFTTAQIASAGFFSAIPMTAITAPMERVKVLLQIQGQQEQAASKSGHKNPGAAAAQAAAAKTGAEAPLRKFSGTLDCAKHLYQTGGIRSVYRGTFMTLARDGPGSAAYFATYEVMKRKLTAASSVSGEQPQLSLSAVMIAGATAGVAMWIPVFPVDTVKSRVQSASGNAGVGTVIRELYSKGGIRAFFPGMGPALARAVPANAATFLGVELAQKAMGAIFG